MMASKVLRLSLTAFILYFCFLAVPGFAAARHAFSPDSLPVLSDFDGDHKLDKAELYSNGAQKSIHVSLGKFAWKSLSFDSGVQERGRLESGDIDRDGDADLVWISQSYPRTFVLWLGDGQGNFFIVPGARAHHYRLEEWLKAVEQPRINGDSDNDDSACAVQSVTFIASLVQSSVSGNVPSQRSTTLAQPPYIRAAWFKVFLKRGPPSHLS